MRNTLRILTVLASVLALLIGSNVLPAHYDLLAPQPCLESGQVNITNGAVTCSATAACPVADGACVVKRFPETGDVHVEYCDCANRPSRDPREYAPACGIISIFGLGGVWADYKCSTAQCANGCNCGPYPVPGSSQSKCLCE